VQCSNFAVCHPAVRCCRNYWNNDSRTAQLPVYSRCFIKYHIIHCMFRHCASAILRCVCYRTFLYTSLLQCHIYYRPVRKGFTDTPHDGTRIVPKHLVYNVILNKSTLNKWEVVLYGFCYSYNFGEVIPCSGEAHRNVVVPCL
jgi:hypothetical protein